MEEDELSLEINVASSNIVRGKDTSYSSRFESEPEGDELIQQIDSSFDQVMLHHKLSNVPFH